LLRERPLLRPLEELLDLLDPLDPLDLLDPPEEELLRDELDEPLRDEPDDLRRDEPDDFFLRPFFDFDSATIDHLAVLSLGSLQGCVQLLCLSAGARACNLEPLEQLALLVAPFLLADPSLLLVQLELDEFALDPVLVV
jgi:hypothetical protein